MTDEEKIICKEYLNDLDKYHSCNEYHLIMGLLDAEPCEDAVSRAEAKRILFDFAGCIVDTLDGIYQQAYKKYNDMMDNLPCVTPKPKTGKWIVNYECPVCGEIRTKYTETCPYCGTKMN